MNTAAKRFTLYPMLGILIPVLLVTILLGAKIAQAAPSKEESSSKSAVSGKKTTDVNFEDVLVQGKYHFSDEAVTTVEEDKVLDSLLGVRKDFKDRIRKSVSRQ